MSYERDEYMLRQEMDHDLIRMRQPMPPMARQAANPLPTMIARAERAEAAMRAICDPRPDGMRADIGSVGFGLIEAEALASSDELWAELARVAGVTVERLKAVLS